MSVEGSLRIRFDGQGPAPGIAIRSDRPIDAARMLEGLTALEAESRVSLLYALCGRSQRLAAVQAFSAACAAEVPSSQVHLAMLCEAAQEYLWRFFIDLPQRLGQAADVAAYVPMRKALLELPDLPEELWLAELERIEAIWRERIYGMPLAAWRSSSAEQVLDWWRAGSTEVARELGRAERFLRQAVSVAAPVARLPRAPEPALLREIAEHLAQQAGYGAAPTWQGGAREVGAWARQQHEPMVRALVEGQVSPVMIRLQARLLELIELLGAMRSVVLGRGNPRCGALTLASDCGLGWVHTARGLLLHRVEMRAERVGRYQVLAPTEWNFHPQGALFAGLTAWREQLGAGGVQDEDFQRWVGLQVLSLDPCVEYQIEVDDA